MYRAIRTSKFSKVIASYLAIQLVISVVQPTSLYALTSGPSQPEFNAFTPIGTSDMVNLSSGDFNYNLPIMDVGGYPLNLSYDSGITTDQEASWVGLGWNLNVGQINRQLRGLPDDFDGDELIYENNIRNNFTAGINTGIKFPIYGTDVLNNVIGLELGVGMKYNNYNGITFNTNYGISFDISEQVSAGLNITNTAGEGATVTPTIGITAKKTDGFGDDKLTTNIGIPFNSRQGLTGLNLSASSSGQYIDNDKRKGLSTIKNYSGSTSSSLSFNDNLSFNPTNQLSFINANLTLDFGLGTELFGPEGPQGQITGFGSIQLLRADDKFKRVKGYGYANSENASPLNSILDFNRENDRTVNKNTTMLPLVNQTYDVYSIEGQGVSGMFRPHRNQVGHVYDQTVTYFGVGGNAGFELGPGAAIHFGGNVKVNPSFTRSGRWEGATNPELQKFKLRNNESTDKIDYEPIHYKTVGELTADFDSPYTSSLISEKDPIKMQIGGGEYNRKTLPNYDVKQYDPVTNEITYGENGVNKIKREQREFRTQSVQMIEYGNVKRGNDGQIRIDKLPDLIPDSNNRVPDNHHVGAKVLKSDGSTYVFGETAYNTKKIEATFATNSSGDCLTGLVTYSHGENTRSNSSGRDHYLNKIHTPAYTHTYLLSSVLSSDYEDLTHDGPTDDDLGAYTKFTYTEPLQHNWRVPFTRSTRSASYSKGLYADNRDDKASYVYGEKELKYVKEIETKTHIAIFDISDRQDGLSAAGENGGVSSVKTKKIDKISLYSKPEYKEAIENGTVPVPIKVAHFEYDYSLCKNLPSHSNYDPIDLNNEDGKLTLKKVYFTYRTSHMGKYTPYVFQYEKDLDNDGVIDNNPDYHFKAFDIWGNYKPIEGGCSVNSNATTPEFPFVQQDNESLQDEYAMAWTMTSIELPSGGKLDLEYESDRYSHVQNKDVMQMFKVVGAGDDPISLGGQNLYQGSNDFDYIYVDIDDDISDETEFINTYLKDIGASDANPMYFRFLLNMSNNKYDYVTGYTLIEKEYSRVFEDNGNTYASIKLKRVKKEGGLVDSNQLVNPIAKSGWYFGRKNLNRLVYGLPAGDFDEPGDLLALGQTFVGAIGAVSDIFFGPNEALRIRNCAKEFKPLKSWIRLYHPDEEKLGGGLRVKSIKLHDNWDGMTNHIDNPLYKNFYGQEYTYTTTEGKTSGVATFEPNGSKENPLIQPFYDKPQKLLAPKEYNYVEKPVGQSLYPSPTITYSRVVTSNLKRDRDIEDTDGNTINIELKKHATGRVINEFYTSKDFPTISDYTDLTPKVDITGILGSILKVRTNKSLTYSQGFVIRTNDMNGKMKSQKVQSEAQQEDEYMSKVEYKYSLNDDGTLNNNLLVMNNDGDVTEKPIGVTYDMVHDFRSYYNNSTVVGIDGNLAGILVFIGILPIPTLLPVVQFHEQELKTVTTTKVINSVGILKEKIAYDLGSKVATENVVWDAQTGDVLLTKTQNEYSDHYYNFKYPANWYYKNMGLASQNIGLSGFIEEDATSSSYMKIVNPSNTSTNIDAEDYLTLGDELLITRFVFTPFPARRTDRVWVADFQSGKALLIDEEGSLFDLESTIPLLPITFNVYRSGYRNLPNEGMASITLQESPIIGGQLTNQVDWANFNIVNSSAVEYNDAWNTQCEFRLPNPDGLIFNEDGSIENITVLEFNPYLYNAKGDWRAIKSYVYMTGRNNGDENFSTRKEGFYKTFKPFYKYTGSNWVIDNPQEEENRWTFASEVSMYSPYGVELENKDALDRYSAAQYGYRYTLPTAVGFNSEYRELAYDNFEDYKFSPLNGDGAEPINPHFGYQDEVEINDNATITDDESHTGRNSIKIEAGASAKSIYRLIECEDDNQNSVPNAENDYAQNCGLKPGSTIFINVLSNDDFGDDGPSGDGITIVSPPSNGIAIVSFGNMVIYTVVQNAPDSFTYQICDANGDCDIATVYINCDSLNGLKN
ncbi:Ig-like domain-containing protein [uncultured Psychroserpens sp.]|uniref:Ig-like domain-containing protein n=1 Tax=uncultured Psychroserpens sp. TaxID=255436 RepID=UPI002624A154|nr:Ig-like domain-containing protein [uncultured Psychroserpens sp.]